MNHTIFKKRLIAGLVLASLFEGVLALVYCCAGSRTDDGQGEVMAVAVFRGLFVLGGLAWLSALLSLIFGYRLAGVSRNLWRYGRDMTSRDVQPEVEPSLQPTTWKSTLSEFAPVIAAAVGIVVLGTAIACFQSMYPSPFEMVESGSVGQLKTLIRDFPGVLGDKNKAGETLMTYAVRHGSFGMVECLLELGADVEGKNRDGESPLMLAAGEPQILSMLLESGADVNTRDRKGWAPLHHAVQQQCRESTEQLLLSGASANARCMEGNTPLLMALDNESDLVELLLRNGASPRFRNAVGETPLHVAARNNHKEAVGLLLRSGAGRDAFSRQGWTPLHVAALQGSVEAAEVFLTFGVDVDITNERMQTPMHCAVQSSHTECIELLLEHGSKIDPAALQGGIHSRRVVVNDKVDIRKMFSKDEAIRNKAGDREKQPFDFLNPLR